MNLRRRCESAYYRPPCGEGLLYPENQSTGLRPARHSRVASVSASRPSLVCKRSHSFPYGTDWRTFWAREANILGRGRYGREPPTRDCGISYMI